MQGVKTTLILLHRMASKVKGLLGSKSSKKTSADVVMEKPAYRDRHIGRDFLVVGTGPSLNEYGERIKEFAERKNLITIGVNHITPFTVPDYHGFSNTFRLKQFGNTVNGTKSRALLSVYFPKQIVSKYCSAPFDVIMWRDSEDAGKCSVDNEDVIYQHGTSTTLMIMVAYVMGAARVYLAGIDGHIGDAKKGADMHYIHIPYKEHLSREKLEWKYKYWWSMVQGKTLEAIHQWALDNNRDPFVYLTPNNYGRKYWDPTLLSNL